MDRICWLIGKYLKHVYNTDLTDANPYYFSEAYSFAKYHQMLFPEKS